MTRSCAVCGNDFDTNNIQKKICSFKCRMQANRDNSRAYKRNKRREYRLNYPCDVCGWNHTVDRHHEEGAIYYLCPNHHSLITRNNIDIKIVYQM